MKKDLVHAVHNLQIAAQKGTLNSFLGLDPNKTKSLPVFMTAETIPAVLKAVIAQMPAVAAAAFDPVTGAIMDKWAVRDINLLLGFVSNIFSDLRHRVGSCNKENEKLLLLALDNDLSPA